MTSPLHETPHPLTVFTLGHGNRSADELVSLLRSCAIAGLVDVRAHPTSGRNPQFHRDEFARWLEQEGIRYLWEGKALGGFRKPNANSPHVALTNPAFRGYADQLVTNETGLAIDRVLELANRMNVALLCAETHPARCHRRLLADALVARGVSVRHILGREHIETHRLSALARRCGAHLIYDLTSQRTLALNP